MEFEIKISARLQTLLLPEMTLDREMTARFSGSIKKCKNKEVNVTFPIMPVTTASFDIIKKIIIKFLRDFDTQKGFFEYKTIWLELDLYSADYIAIFFDRDFLSQLSKMNIEVYIRNMA